MDNKIILQNFEKNDNINQKIYERNIPSNNLQMNFSPRPVLTKYSFIPILDNRIKCNSEINIYKCYNTEETFYSGDCKPPFTGYAIAIDKESSLRNQFFALQKSDQKEWVPSSNSDLYENNINYININNNLDENLLFKNENFNKFNPNISNKIGNEIFYNNTRVQLKNI